MSFVAFCVKTERKRERERERERERVVMRPVEKLVFDCTVAIDSDAENCLEPGKKYVS